VKSIDEAETARMVTQCMREEMFEFEKADHLIVSQDDLFYAANLRMEIEERRATLKLLRRGEITVRLNHETGNFDDAIIEKTPAFKIPED